MNSILQCLSNTEELRDYCLMNFHRTDLDNNSTVSTALMEGECSINFKLPARFKSAQNTHIGAKINNKSTCSSLLFLTLQYQSLQSWPRACGHQSITRPSVHPTLEARSKDTRQSLWAASKWLSPALLPRPLSGPCWKTAPDSPVPLVISWQSTGCPGISALPAGRPSQRG